MNVYLLVTREYVYMQDQGQDGQEVDNPTNSSCNKLNND